jgi:hypothetical protein
MTFQHPFQLTSTRSNTYSNRADNCIPTASNTPSNGCSPTPHTPRALEAPLPASVAGRVSAAQGKGQEGPRYRHACGNGEISDLVNHVAARLLHSPTQSIICPPLGNHNFVTVVTVTSTTRFPSDDRARRATDPSRLSGLPPDVKRSQARFGRGSCARTASTPFTLIAGATAAETPIAATHFDRGRGGGAPNLLAGRYIDLLALSRGSSRNPVADRSLQNLGGDLQKIPAARSEKFGGAHE